MNRNSNLKAIILAAGEGKRLMPYTSGIPKCMVKVNDIPLLKYQLKTLKNAGINDITIVSGYCAEKINLNGVKSYTNKNYNDTNMVWSLFKAEPELHGDVIVSYGDIAYSSAVLEKLINSRYDISVVVDKSWEKYWDERFENPLDDAETLIVEDSKIKEIGKKPKDYNEIMGQYIGLMKFSNVGINYLKNTFLSGVKNNSIQNKSPEIAFMTDLLQSMIDIKIDIWSVPVRGNWVEIDTVKDLKLEITKRRLESIYST